MKVGTIVSRQVLLVDDKQKRESVEARNQAESERAAAEKELEGREGSSGQEEESHHVLAEKLQESRVEQERLERGMEVLEEREQGLQRRKASLVTERARLVGDEEDLASRSARLQSESEAVLLEQKKDLSTAIDQLLADIEAGEKYMKVYKQMKMYNDDELNPVLRGQKG